MEPAQTDPVEEPPASVQRDTDDVDPDALMQIPLTEDDDSYEVVAPPVGATVPYLPDEADEEIVGETTYFVYDETLPAIRK